MDFNIGDRVRFKSLDEITRLDALDQIRFGWNKRMDPLCGIEFTIKRMRGEKIFFEEDAKELHDSEGERDMWSISASMLEPVPENNTAIEEVIADDRLFDMLIG